MKITLHIHFYLEILSHKYSIIATSLDRQNEIIKTTCLIISLHTEKAIWYYTKFQHHQVMTSHSINNLWVYPIQMLSLRSMMGGWERGGDTS